MARLHTALLLLVLCAGSLEAWWWSLPPTTEKPAGTTPVTKTYSTPATIKTEDLSGLGEEIINVATGIRKLVQAWDETTTRTTTPTLNPTPGTANGTLAEEERTNITSKTDGVSRGKGPVTVAALGSEQVLGFMNVPGGGPCLPVPSDWPLCSGRRPSLFSLPNFFNHTSVEQVGAVLRQWAWLKRAGCHRATEAFLCLLLVPECPLPLTPLHLPCRSFCYGLQDRCWGSLEHGRLPLDCDLLPDSEQCVSDRFCKGNPRVRMYPPHTF